MGGSLRGLDILRRHGLSPDIIVTIVVVISGGTTEKFHGLNNKTASFRKFVNLAREKYLLSFKIFSKLGFLKYLLQVVLYLAHAIRICLTANKVLHRSHYGGMGDLPSCEC